MKPLLPALALAAALFLSTACTDEAGEPAGDTDALDSIEDADGYRVDGPEALAWAEGPRVLPEVKAPEGFPCELPPAVTMSGDATCYLWALVGTRLWKACFTPNPDESYAAARECVNGQWDSVVQTLPNGDRTPQFPLSEAGGADGDVE